MSLIRASVFVEAVANMVEDDEPVIITCGEEQLKILQVWYLKELAKACLLFFQQRYTLKHEYFLPEERGDYIRHGGFGTKVS